MWHQQLAQATCIIAFPSLKLFYWFHGTLWVSHIGHLEAAASRCAQFPGWRTSGMEAGWRTWELPKVVCMQTCLSSPPLQTDIHPSRQFDTCITPFKSQPIACIGAEDSFKRSIEAGCCVSRKLCTAPCWPLLKALIFLCCIEKHISKSKI